MKIALIYISPNRTTEIITAKLCGELGRFIEIEKINLGKRKFHDIEDIDPSIFKI